MAKSKSKVSRRKKVTPPTPHRTGVTPPKLDPKQIPNHVALVMDGNGRWAKQRGLARTAGQNYVSGLSFYGKTLQGKTILAISREGTVYDPITTGSPSNRTALFNSALGRITFDSNIPFNPGETVWAMWKD